MADEVVFRDRREAGRLLAKRLAHYQGKRNVVVLGLPRGGVPVADEVARELSLPLDVCVVRKLGVPQHRELAMGAVASGGVEVLDEALIDSLGISLDEVEETRRVQREELARREVLFRGNRQTPETTGKIVILVDDGVATGSTMKAAVRAIRERHPARVVVAIPVAPPSVRDDFRREADELVCLATPEPFYAVGQWYEDFRQVEDEEVQNILQATQPVWAEGAP